MSVRKSARKDVGLPRFCRLEVRCGNEAMNAAVAVYVCSTNHALITQSEGVGGLGVGEGDRDELRLDFRRVIRAFVGFDLLGEISLPAAHRKADYVAVAVHARAHGIARVEEIEILIFRA